MKSKFYFFLWFFATSTLLLQSCREKEDPTFLEISAKAVSFANAGGEESVTITTNRESWVATSPLEQSWVTLTQNGNRLSLNAKANTEGIERTGYILVNSGDVAAKISITQSAGDILLSLSAEVVNFTKKGGEQRIDVVSNSSFKVEVDDGSGSWLKPTYIEGASYLNLSADANSNTATRTGKVYITAGSLVREIAVTQKGHSLILLPLLSWKTDLREVVLFEEERGSVLDRSLPDFIFATYTFITDNSSFPLISYSFSESGNYLKATSATKNKELYRGATFEQYMVDEGFEKAENLRYVHKSFPYEVTIKEESDGTVIQTMYKAKQNRQFPTFSTLPLKTQTDWTSLPDASIKGKAIDFVKDAETGFGSTLNAANTNESTNLFWFDPSQSDQEANGFVARVYSFYSAKDIKGPIDATYLGLLNIARTISNSLNRAWWYDDVTSQYYMTNEFNRLLADEGFVFMIKTKGYDLYAKSSNGVLDILATRVIQFTDFRPGEDLNDIMVYKNAASSSVVSILTNKEKLIKFAREMNYLINKSYDVQMLKRIK